MTDWMIRFEEPKSEQAVYAGWTKDGALGYAPRVETAAMFESREVAERTLANSFGPSMREIGYVIRSVEVESD